MFGNPIMPKGFSAREAAISAEMVQYWGAFVRGEKLSEWMPSTSESLLLGDAVSRMEPVPAVCKFWDSVGYVIPRVQVESSLLI